jgi:hypothetical protein
MEPSAPAALTGAPPQPKNQRHDKPAPQIKPKQPTLHSIQETASRYKNNSW